MYLASLHLKNFRNHSLTSIDCGRGINFLLGNNGQGKTNVVEAISYLCLTKSFYAGSDAVVLQFGEGMFEVNGTIVSDEGRTFEVRVAYLKDENEKYYMINRKRVEPLSSVIGRFPIVVFSPEHGSITMGGPGERRKFLDLVISQSNRAYFKTLLDYRGILKQRNRILLDSKLGRGGTSGGIEPWNEQLVRSGTAIWQYRRRFLREFAPLFASVYGRFVDGDEVPGLVYRPLASGELPEDSAEVAEKFAAALAGREHDERRMGTSLVGPHRDEVTFTLNGREVRPYASQGQHKTFIISLKLAEFHYLREKCGETPLLMLDDVFAELDDERTSRVVGYIGDMGQAFLTSTHRGLLGGWNTHEGDFRHFTIEAGAVADHGVMDHA